jgi:hypothetical protein
MVKKALSIIVLLAIVLLSPNPLEAAVSGVKAWLNPQLRSHVPGNGGHQPADPAVSMMLAAQKSAQERTLIPVTPGKSVEILKGVAAVSHMKNVQARRPQAFSKSREHLRALGWTPTEHVVVMRTVNDRLARGNSDGIVPAQVIDTNEGEVIFWSWDDGNNSTWEGEMYAVRYEDGAEITSDVQMDTVANQVIYDDVVHHQPGVLSYYHYVGNDGMAPSAAALFAAMGTPSRSDIQLATSTFDGRQFGKDWLACVVAACAAAIFGCAVSGPLYVECLALSCAGATVGCALATIIQYL